jgi:hypothetical protein
LRFRAYSVYITNQFQTTFAPGGGEKNLLVDVAVISKEENSQDFCFNYVKEFGFGNTLPISAKNYKKLHHTHAHAHDAMAMCP